MRTLYFDQLRRPKVIDDKARTVGERETVIVIMYGKGILVGGTQYIPAPTECLMRQMQLCQQCGGKVGLVTELADLLMCFDGSAHPYQWYLVAQRMCLCVHRLPTLPSTRFVRSW